MKEKISDNLLLAHFGVCILIFFSVVLFHQRGCAQEKSQYVITGRVVDDNGRSLANASVFFEPVDYKSNSFERFIEGKSPDPSGKFKIIRSKVKAFGSENFLFVAADESLDGLSTIRPPFDEVRRFDESFNGKMIRLGDRDTVNVGDVHVQFWYGRASLTFARQIPWQQTYLKIKDRNGNSVYFQSLSESDIEKYVQKDGSELLVSLPVGKWKVELLDWSGKQIYAESPFIQIRRNQDSNVDVR